MDSPLRIESLPNELIERIVNDPILSESKNDWINLRFTCKRLGLFATQSIAKKYLSKVSVFFTNRSLQYFMDLCANPEIGPYIQYVHFATARVHPEQTNDHVNTLTYSPEADDCQSREIRSRIHACIDQYAEEHMLRNSGKIIELITTAFCSLKMYNNAIALALLDHVDDPEDHDFYRRLYRDLEHRHDVRYQETISTVITAASRSRVSINRLELGHFYAEELWGYKSTDTSFLFDDIHSLRHACSCLKLLAFRFYSKLDHGSIRTLRAILLEARELEAFTFNVMQDRGYCSIKKDEFSTSRYILRTVSSNCLSKLTLHNSSVSETTLIKLLGKYHQTLSYVQMTKCTILGQWHHIWTYMLDTCRSLQYLHLEKLFVAAGEIDSQSEYITEKYIDFSLAMEDQEEIQVHLRKLIKNPDGLIPPTSSSTYGTTDQSQRPDILT